MVTGVKNCCTYRTVRTAVFKSAADMGIRNEDDLQTQKSSLVQSVKIYTVGNMKIIIR
jgi:hypothetical protein